MTTADGRRQRRASRAALSRLAIVAAEQVRAASDSRDVAELHVCQQVAHCLATDLSDAAWQWIRRHFASAAIPKAQPPELVAAAEAVLANPPLDADPLAHFYEHFLKQLDASTRKRHGVFYTPPSIARAVVRLVDAYLRDEFQLTHGILDAGTWHDALAGDLVSHVPAGIDHWSSLIRILDPALGAGVFLTELIRLARTRFTDVDAWNATAPSLLARLGGYELLPAAAFLAVVRIAVALAETGYRFESEATLTLHLGDALAAPWRPPWTVVIGNPPFSGVSATKHAWIDALLHGHGPSGEPRANYFEVNGQPLAERKHWLHDDYVKFLRVAHEQVEAAGMGIVALVTNHGYLDNVTFRGLRAALVESFPRISIIDLHGNAKRRERTPDDQRDENIFIIEQGVAIALLRRPGLPVTPQGERADVWGTRAEKLAAIEQALEFRWLPLSTVGAAFHVETATGFPEYERGWPLDEAMPVNTTAPVTARDHFLVARNIAELEVRCRDFCDPSLSDDEIRARYFTRTRSQKYPPGDTRGWKLSDAREQMRAIDWSTLVKPVQYRPLDPRVMLWADWLVDWPRSEVMSHLLSGDNLALITRRQAPPGQPWTFTWVCEGLTLDGVIRSDNRGSESIFPLWLHVGERRTPNFAAGFVTAVHTLTRREFSAPIALGYIYALLHATTYRQRYAAALASGFPRVMLPQDVALYERLALLGQRLLATHLLREPTRPLPFHGDIPTRVDAGFPRHAGRRVYLNAQAYFAGISPSTWKTKIGSHQVCQKLLKDRRGAALYAEDLDRSGIALASLRRARALVRLIDQAVANVNWETDFAQR